MYFESIDQLVASAPTDLGLSDWVTLSRKDVADFARVTRATEWIHLDEERARKESPFGTTVAHGYLTLGLATHFITALMEVEGHGLGVNYGLERVRFPAPVPVGSSVRASGTLESASPTATGVRTVVDLVYECDASDKPACHASVVSVLLPSGHRRRRREDIQASGIVDR